MQYYIAQSPAQSQTNPQPTNIWFSSPNITSVIVTAVISAVLSHLLTKRRDKAKV